MLWVPFAMLKLTRLNNHVVAINPDHICSADALPDTTLQLIGGEKIIVRESLDELCERVIEFRRQVRRPFESADSMVPSVTPMTLRHRTDCHDDDDAGPSPPSSTGAPFRGGV